MPCLLHAYMNSPDYPSYQRVYFFLLQLHGAFQASARALQSMSTLSALFQVECHVPTVPTQAHVYTHDAVHMPCAAIPCSSPHKYKSRWWEGGAQHNESIFMFWY